MTLDFWKERGTPLDKQTFTWRDIVQEPISKLDNDAFTRVRVILMNGLCSNTNRFLHAYARSNGALRVEAARVRRGTHHQQTTVNWLLSADHDPLETTIAFEQVAIEVTAAIAKAEPDPYLAQAHRFGLLEDFDHLYRFSALMDRLQGKDANNILQSYTDVVAGRPTIVEHRAPIDDVRKPYDKNSADPLSKLHALTLVGAENQTRDYYMTSGPMFSDPLARQLYAEIASIEEQHVTHYESLLDPEETWLEKWLMHELCDLYNFYSCAQAEEDPRIKAIWERFTDYELGQFHFVADLFKKHMKMDPASFLPRELPQPLEFKSQRDFVRDVLKKEVGYRAVRDQIGPMQDSPETIAYRETINGRGSPSDRVAGSYRFTPGTELSSRVRETATAGE